MAHRATDRAGQRIGLRFLSLQAEVYSEAPELVGFCGELFGRFLNESESPAYRLRICSEDGGWRVKDSTIDAVVQERSWLPGIVTARLLETAGNEIGGHDLFHGAALSREGRGLVICGESGFGKSTLTLSLLQRGWKFLSDEVAALEQGPPRLVPFPKAIELRPDAAHIVGIDARGPMWRRGKLLRDADELFPNCLSGPCALSTVVFLESGAPTKSQVSSGEIELVVHRASEALVPELEKLEGVVEARWQGVRDGCPVLLVLHEPGFAAWRLDEPLGRRGVLIVDSSAEVAAPADFDREPVLRPLETHEGIGRLLGQFRGRRALARRIGSQGGDFGQLFLSLMKRFGAVRFFGLVVGRLEPMLATLEEAVRSAPQEGCPR